ncbi:hypothetical protein MG293_006590 [Ovis ammon polii]|uniref:Uncharacterized protein n=1 Tax=Ovis ammon polii TaxID=230172 RepID=A0AAD4UES2_OVIAM|nr:hypothetical protein MG293_006590 [Ovis ammon polii]KAI4570371.1 hypothetical protein MJT46_005888 [Ovis ammon polii x Ovis aries]
MPVDPPFLGGGRAHSPNLHKRESTDVYQLQSMMSKFKLGTYGQDLYCTEDGKKPVPLIQGHLCLEFSWIPVGNNDKADKYA